MAESLASPDNSIRFRARLVAPLLALGTIVILEGMHRLFHLLPPSPSPVFLLVLACGVFISGLRSGLLSAVVAMVYLGFFFHGTEGPWLINPSPVTITRMLVFGTVAPAIVLIIGVLKRRLLAAERASAAFQRFQAEELLRLATETAGIGTFSHDPAAALGMNVSEQYRTNYGLLPGEPLFFSRLVNEIVVPVDRERVAQAVQAALDPVGNGMYEIEYRIRRPSDGVERWMAVKGQALPSAEGPRMVVGATLDITERKEAERGLLLLKAAVESANDSIIITDASLDAPGPRIEYVNAAFCRMTGYEVEELLGKTPRILQGARTDMELLRRLRSSLQAEGSFQAETINYRKDGQPYYVEWRITAVRNAAGEVTQWVAVERNVTDRVHAAQERERTLASERSTRLELERAGRVKDEFLATLSHELRTPLNAIVGWTHLLKADPTDPEVQRSAVEVFERNSKSLVQLIEDLLDVSRIVSGKMRLATRSVELVDVVQAALGAVRPAAEARDVRIESVLDPRAGPINGDPDRLQQVVWNLLSNAMKFTPKGGKVQVRLERSGSVVKIIVSDTGQGIEPEFLPYLFERFRQADSSSTRSHSGLGIGLALVRHLVELHGGTVEAASAGVGQGATFTVSLPMPAMHQDTGMLPFANNGYDKAGAGKISAVREGEPNGRPARKSKALDGLRIVAVDDDCDARELLMAVLSAQGAAVTTATSVAEGMAAVRSQRPDLLLCDIEMPQEDGYAMIARLRRLSATEGGSIPAVALTAYACQDDQRRTLLAGYQRHMSKPVNPPELIATLAGLVGRPAEAADVPAI